MDPSEDFPPPPAFYPPPAPAAAALPPTSTAASLVGPRIFVLSPLSGNKYEVASEAQILLPLAIFDQLLCLKS